MPRISNFSESALKRRTAWNDKILGKIHHYPLKSDSLTLKKLKNSVNGINGFAEM
jgi:hypothetical protein